MKAQDTSAWPSSAPGQAPKQATEKATKAQESLTLRQLLQQLHEELDHCDRMQTEITGACVPVVGDIEYGPISVNYLEFHEHYSEAHRAIMGAVNRVRTLIGEQADLHVALVKNL